MNARERVERALLHEEGPVPLDFGASPVTGIHVSLLEKIRERYDLEKRPVRLLCPLQMIGIIEEDVREALGIDTTCIMNPGTLFGFPLGKWKEWRAPWGQILLVPGGFQTTVDRQGTVYLYPQGDTSVPPSGRMPLGSWYFDSIVRQPPIVEEELNPVDNLEEFPFIQNDLLDYFQDEIGPLQEGERFVFGTFTGDTGLGDIARVPGAMLKHPRGIRSETEWYISTIARPDYLRRVFDEQTDRALVNLAKIHKVVGDAVGAVFICGTDFGTQESTFCSLEGFSSLYLPYYKKVNDWIHANTGWRTFKHSCGAVERLIPGFIEAGFDILNPLQCSARGMEPQMLKRKYGGRLVFWGGGVDTQRTLPFGNPAQVRAQVLERCRAFSNGGGFVFNAIHNVQAKTPVENFAAMVDAVHEFNRAGG